MPTPPIRSNAPKRSAGGCPGRFSNAVYLADDTGERMAFAAYTPQGAAAVITLKHPPVNALSLGLRTAIADGLERATSDASIAAVVIVGSGSAFCGGADVAEFS